MVAITITKTPPALEKNSGAGGVCFVCQANTLSNQRYNLLCLVGQEEWYIYQIAVDI